METVSVIIVNYNTSQLCFDCVQSILKFETGKDIEFIIVDNASKQNETEVLRDKLKDFVGVKLVFSKQNLGFSGGNMLGFQYALGNYLAFINSDVVFVEPVFDTLIANHIEHPEMGVCGPQILDTDRKETISFRSFEGMRYKLLGKKFLAKTQPKAPKMWENQHKSIPVDFIIGSFMFFKKEAFCEIGGFDTNIFLYYEETDICYRLNKLGFSTYFVPATKYVHLEGKSSLMNLDLKLEHLLSYLYVVRKNFGYWKYFVIKNYLLISYAFKAPFKKKNRFIFFKLLFAGESLALSLRHQQKAKIF